MHLEVAAVLQDSPGSIDVFLRTLRRYGQMDSDRTCSTSGTVIPFNNRESPVTLATAMGTDIVE